MKRFRFIFFMLVCHILIAGCTKESINSYDEEGESTYLQVHILHADIGSRTIGAPTFPGTTEENFIAEIIVYLMDNNRIVKIKNVTIQGGTSDYISDLIPIEADILNKELQLFVIANSDQAEFNIRTALDFKGLYSNLTDIHKLITPGQMVMSNQVEQSPVPAVTVTSENTILNPARVNILLDRLAVKIEPMVSVNFDANFEVGQIENLFFKDFTFKVKAAGLLNGITEFNLEQQWSKETPIQLLSPSWFYKAEEQYFNKYYNTINDYLSTNTPPFIPISENIKEGYFQTSSPFYCLENNSPFYDYTGSNIPTAEQIKTKYKGLATGVIFRVQATQNDIATNFYYYADQYYSDTDTDRQALATAANLSPEDFNNITLLRGKGIEVYEDGNIYYTYWIKDKNPAYSGDDYDLNYAIIRNSYYMLKVNRINSIGKDIPGGGYKPEEPIDKPEDIEIIAISQEWTLVDVGHDFN